MTWCAKTAEEINVVGRYAAGGTGHCEGRVVRAKGSILDGFAKGIDYLVGSEASESLLEAELME